MSHAITSSPPKPWEKIGGKEKLNSSLNTINERSLPTLSYQQPPLYYHDNMPSFPHNRPYYGYASYPSSGYGYRGGYDTSAAMMSGHAGGTPLSLTRRMESSSREAFRFIDTIVQAVGGFAQMLDSTFYATYSSFMAMISVAEQFGNMKHYVTSINSARVFYRTLRRLFYNYILRRPIPPSLDQVSLSEFQKFEQHSRAAYKSPAISRAPLLLFLATSLGVPYLLSKLIRALQTMEERRQQEFYERLQIDKPQEVAVALYDFVPQMDVDLPLKAGDHLRVLLRVDPATGQPTLWWKAELDGRIGYVPCNYVRLLENKEATI
jgi:peroxin-13